MATNNTNFKLAEELVINASEKVIRGTMLDLMSAVVLDTPRDTGFLQGNWQMELNFFPDTVLDNTSKEAAESLAGQTLARYGIKDTIYFGNNMEYARSVEDGGPTNRPHGMLKRNVASLKQTLKQNAAKNRI